MWILLVYFLVLLLLFFYITLIKPLYYWKEKGIPYLRPFPVAGNMIDLVMKKKSTFQIFQELYKAFPQERYNGIHHYTKPVLLLRDLELIKKIFIKDFDHFTDHYPFITEDIDPLMGQNLFVLRGQRWRNTRAMLSPSFTASKLRFMYSILVDCAENLTKYFKDQGRDVTVVEMKDVFSRCTSDALVSFIYGIQINSFTERSNDFLMMNKHALNFSGLVGFLSIILINVSPTLCKLFGIKFLPSCMFKFYHSVTMKTIKQREKWGFIRPDVLHLLMKTKKKHLHMNDKYDSKSFVTAVNSKVGNVDKDRKPELTDEDITAQAMSFFIGGFDTSSTVLAYAAYEIAIHPDVQRKLQVEIDETSKECNGHITWEVLEGMRYLDMVVSEALRKWPPAPQTDRMCVKEYTIQPEKPGERPLTIYKGQVVMISIIGIHHDPRHFPNPDIFDPERFNLENKKNIDSVAYLPFGVGQRTCIGMRFGLMEIKTVICELLKSFDIVPVKETMIPLKIGTNAFNFKPDEGFLLGLQQRKTKAK